MDITSKRKWRDETLTNRIIRRIRKSFLLVKVSITFSFAGKLSGVAAKVIISARYFTLWDENQILHEGSLNTTLAFKFRSFSRWRLLFQNGVFFTMFSWTFKSFLLIFKFFVDLWKKNLYDILWMSFHIWTLCACV